jgi:adenosylmethionine-8-amino-7-oxononanoate aminotransferase
VIAKCDVPAKTDELRGRVQNQFSAPSAKVTETTASGTADKEVFPLTRFGSRAIPPLLQSPIIMPSDAALFPRNFRKDYPIAVRGEGCWIIDQSGRRFLDASGQAAVVSIGHGVAEIGGAMAEQASRIAFAHTTQFHSEPAEKLALRLLALAPSNFRGGRVYFTSGGSEATETAIKLVRQFHLESGQPARYRVISRRQSYHGSTLGAMIVSGNVARRVPYQPLLAEWGHIAPCFCYHCPFGKKFPDCAIACADDLETFLRANDDASVAAFIFEPVVGATLGAAVPPDGYVQRIAEICRTRGILLAADEIMSGMGRTGKPFAVQHWNVEPDLILVGKGIASGYAPLGAVLVSARIVEAFERGSGAFQHGFTYQAHPVATAAGNAVLDYIEAHQLLQRVAPSGEMLRAELAALQSHPHVGEIRGLGMLLGIEFVKNKSTREPFPRDKNIAERVQQGALEETVLTYPTQGCVDGSNGDHILLAPPFTIVREECAQIARGLRSALQKVFPA